MTVGLGHVCEYEDKNKQRVCVRMRVCESGITQTRLTSLLLRPPVIHVTHLSGWSTASSSISRVRRLTLM